MALGRAIVRDPKVFLFDEPLSNLDAKLRVQMRVELKKLHERLAVTSIYVTHDQVEAMTLGDRVVVMKDGVVQQVGEPLELYNTPGQPLRGGLHRLAGDELRRRDAVGQQRQAVGRGAGPQDRPARACSPAASRAATAPRRRSASGPRTSISPARPIRPSLCFEAEVEVVEQLGSEILLDTRAGNGTFVAWVEPDAAHAAHDHLKLAINPERLHLFDAQTEAAI